MVVKLLIDNFLIERLFFIQKVCLLSTLLTNFLVSKNASYTDPVERLLRSLLGSLLAKTLRDNIFIERLGLKLAFMQLLIASHSKPSWKKCCVNKINLDKD